MGLKTAGVGHFQIPTAPAAGVSVVSGTANALTGTAIVLSASTSAMYITGVHVETSAALAATYILVQLCVGGSGAETSIGQYLVPLSTGSTVALGYRQIYPPIPMAAGARLSVKTADSVGSKTYLVTAECILATNVVDDGIAVGTVTTVTNQLTAAAIATGVWQDATAGDFSTASSIGKSLYIANVAPGGTGGHMISGTNAGTTTLGALTVTGATIHTGNVSMAAGLTVTQSTLNAAGVSITGNGTGNGLDCIGGATSGDGIAGTGGGSGNGMHAAAGATGKGIGITTTAGDGLSITPTGGSAIVATGNGTNMHGIVATGGTAGTSDGMKLVAGTGGVDFRANQTGTVTTVTNLTNAPTAGDLTAAMKASVTAAVPTAAVNAGATWDVALSGHLTAGTSGAALNSAGGAADPWATALPGAYAAGTAGKIIGDKIVASVTADVGITQAGADKVWGTAARVLTAGTNIVLAKGTGVTGFNDIAATAIVSAGAITTSAGKVSGVILTDTVTTYTGNTLQTGDSFARIGAAGAGLTAIGDTRIANLDATVSSRSTYAGGAVASVTGAVGSVTGLTASDVGSIKTTLGVAGAGLTALGDTRLANLDAAVSTRSTLAAGAAMTLTGLYDAAKIAPDNASILLIKAKSDQMAFTAAGKVDANVKAVVDVTLLGTGAVGDLFRVA